MRGTLERQRTEEGGGGPNETDMRKTEGRRESRSKKAGTQIQNEIGEDTSEWDYSRTMMVWLGSTSITSSTSLGSCAT